MIVLSAMLALGRLQSVDFGPKVTTLTELCQAYVPPGEKVVVSPQLQSRHMLVRLKGRNWTQVQDLLKTGFGIEAVSDNGVWRIRTDDARTRADLAAVSQSLKDVGAAIQQEAAGRLGILKASTMQQVRQRMDTMAEEVIPKTTGYKVQEWQNAARQHQETVSVGRVLVQMTSVSEWISNIRASEEGRSLISGLAPRIISGPQRDLLNTFGLTTQQLDEIQADAIPANQFGDQATTAPIFLREEFRWTKMDVLSELAQAAAPSPSGRAGGSITSQRQSLGSSFPSALKAFKKHWPLEPVTADKLAGIPGAEKSFQLTSAPTFSGLMSDWSRQTDGEVIAVIDPMLDYSAPAIKSTARPNLMAGLVAWNTVGDSQFGEEFTTLRRKPDALLTPSIVWDLLGEEMLRETEQQWRESAQMMRFVTVQGHNGVLLAQPRLQPFFDGFKMPVAAYWKLNETGAPTLDGFREYVRQVPPDDHARWRGLMSGGQGHFAFDRLIDLYPYLRAMEWSGSTSNFWSRALANQNVEMSLTIERSAEALKDAVAQGSLTAALAQQTLGGRGLVTIRTHLDGPWLTVTATMTHQGMVMPLTSNSIQVSSPQ